MLTGPQKAFASMLITLVGGVAALLMVEIPDNPTVQLWGAIAAGVCTLVANTLGVYYTTNKAPAPVVVQTYAGSLKAEAAAFKSPFDQSNTPTR